MKQEIQNELLEQVGEVAEMTKEGLMVVVEVLQEQCPILVEEILRWFFIYNLLIFIVGFGVVLYLLRKLPKWIPTMVTAWEDNSTMSKEDFLWIPMIVLSLIGIPLMCTHWEWLQIWVAPRLFLLEYIGKLL